MDIHSSRTFSTVRGLAVLVSLSIIACSNVSHSSVTNNNISSSDNGAMEDQNKKTSSENIDGRLVSANIRFGFKLFSEVAKQNAGKNVLISPARIVPALAMTYNGAAGETKQGMERALEVQGM